MAFCRQCAKELSRRPPSQAREFCNKRCYGSWLSRTNCAEDHPRWKGGRLIRKDGYVRISIKGKSYFEHRLIMELHLGRKLRSDEDVHHINGMRSDNQLENLELLSEAQHVALHNKERAHG